METRPFLVVFVCAHNSCRSPMAVGFARSHRLPGVQFQNAGLRPRGRVDPLTVHVMREAGVDIRDLRSRVLTTDLARRADLLVLLAGHDEELGPLPFPAKALLWQVDDPLGWPLEEYEEAREAIRRAVSSLVPHLRALAEGPMPSPAAPTRADFSAPKVPAVGPNRPGEAPPVASACAAAG